MRGYTGILIGLTSLSLRLASASYIPPYLEGTPLAMKVASLDPPDFTGNPVYNIQFSIQPMDDSVAAGAAAGTTGSLDGFIHRTAADFVKFDDMLHSRWVFDDISDVVLPSTSDMSVTTLDAYLQTAAGHKSIMTSTELADFLGINWSGSDLKFLCSLPDFMQVVIPQLYRAPEFPPEPPIIDTEVEAILAPETPFEIYVYLTAFRSRGNLANYLEFFSQFVNSQPGFFGPGSNNNGEIEASDVLPPGSSGLAMPVHFNQTYVHFLPGGYLNGHTVRISYLGKSKFNFLHEELLREWLTKLYVEARPDFAPKRILDIGTGPGFSAFVLAELYPEAEIVAVDLSPPYIRMARKWAELRNVTNIQFYAANAEDMTEWLPASDAFDLVNYAYVLHEMPATNARSVINEMYRLLKPGGLMNGFEVPFFEDVGMRLAYTEFNTWGHDAWEAEGEKGPEPYMFEYEFGTTLTESLVDAGFVNLEVVEYSYFESIFTAAKPT